MVYRGGALPGGRGRGWAGFQRVARDYTGEGWREALRIRVESEAWEERIREATRRGNPLGSDAFVERVGQDLGRDLRVRPPGRPAKKPVQMLATMG